jgi:hypothetical protein
MPLLPHVHAAAGFTFSAALLTWRENYADAYVKAVLCKRMLFQ